MIIKNKLLTAFAATAITAATAFGYITFARGASAGQVGSGLDDGTELQTRASVTLAQAVAAAQTAATGAVDEIDLEYWHDTLVYNVDIGSKDVKVDAATGDVLEASADD